MGEGAKIIKRLVWEARDLSRRAKLGKFQGGGGVAEGYPRFDKGGGVGVIFYFLRDKNITF